MSEQEQLFPRMRFDIRHFHLLRLIKYACYSVALPPVVNYLALCHQTVGVDWKCLIQPKLDYCSQLMNRSPLTPLKRSSNISFLMWLGLRILTIGKC